VKHALHAALALFLAVALTPGAHAALPGNSAEGKRLHDANCTACHDTRVYVREGRSVRSLDGLRQQLESCSHMAGKQFSAIETQNLIKYLNDTFYQFR
jgi:mono/diheme cytochrome c family protein